MKFLTIFFRKFNFRIFSGITNLASNFDCSNLGSFRDMTFLWFFKKFIFRKLKFEDSINLKFLTL